MSNEFNFGRVELVFRETIFEIESARVSASFKSEGVSMKLVAKLKHESDEQSPALRSCDQLASEAWAAYEAKHGKLPVGDFPHVVVTQSEMSSVLLLVPPEGREEQDIFRARLASVDSVFERIVTFDLLPFVEEASDVFKFYEWIHPRTKGRSFYEAIQYRSDN